jgi:hypothetical protein
MTNLSDAVEKITLDNLKARWEAGHKDALPAVLGFCLYPNRKLPEWARLAWLEIFETISKSEGKTWDALLGPISKGTHRKAHELHTKLRYRIVCRILDSKDKVGPALFKEIAKEITASGTPVGWRTVKDIYYAPLGKLLRAQIRLLRHVGLDSDFLA